MAQSGRLFQRALAPLFGNRWKLPPTQRITARMKRSRGRFMGTMKSFNHFADERRLSEADRDHPAMGGNRTSCCGSPALCHSGRWPGIRRLRVTPAIRRARLCASSHVMSGEGCDFAFVMARSAMPVEGRREVTGETGAGQSKGRGGKKQRRRKASRDIRHQSTVTDENCACNFVQRRRFSYSAALCFQPLGAVARNVP